MLYPFKGEHIIPPRNSNTPCACPLFISALITSPGGQKSRFGWDRMSSLMAHWDVSSGI